MKRALDFLAFWLFLILMLNFSLIRIASEVDFDSIGR